MELRDTTTLWGPEITSQTIPVVFPHLEADHDLSICRSSTAVPHLPW